MATGSGRPTDRPGADGGDPARRALYTAAQLARATRARVGVISVVPLFFGRGGPSVEPWDDHAVHQAQLAEAGELLARSGIQPDLIRVSGDPAAMIEAVAERDGYDTLVVGAEQKGLLARILTGSVAQRLAERSRFTVVVAQ